MQNIHLLRRCLLLVLIAVLSWTALASAGTVSAADDATWLLGQINAIRAQHGLGPMALNAQLTASATAHSKYLANNVWSNPHIEANGSTPKSRMLAAGYVGEYYSENVYGGGLATVQIAFDWWLGSPIHYAGIVNAGHTEIGIGIASGPYGQFFTTDFGGRGSLSAAPQPVPATANAPQSITAANAPVATRRPLPTSTATSSLTPSQTFTPHPTASRTPSGTAIPPTPTAIELAVSPLAISKIIATNTPVIGPTNSPSAVTITTSLPIPGDGPVSPQAVALAILPTATATVTSGADFVTSQSAGSDALRALIPILIGVQALIFAGLLFRRSRSG